MCFHFPLMPRMYLAAKRGDREPDRAHPRRDARILPDGCQWGLFLRNHDELTLEMVTDAERDEMYAEYAADPKMRRNTGIGRRLAPLLDNSRPLMELFHCAAASRCPAARSCTTATRSGWATTSTSATATASARRCSGRPTATPASRTADFEQLYLPPIMDPVYGYQAVNVEAQRRNPRLVPALAAAACSTPAARAPAAGHRHLRPGAGDEPGRVRVRRGGPADYGTGPDPVRRQPVTARRSRWRCRCGSTTGGRRWSCWARCEFPRIGELTYLLTLPPHGFFWFELV